MPELEAFLEAEENRHIIEEARKEWDSPCKMCRMYPCDCPEKEEVYAN